MDLVVYQRPLIIILDLIGGEWPHPPNTMMLSTDKTISLPGEKVIASLFVWILTQCCMNKYILPPGGISGIFQWKVWTKTHRSPKNASMAYFPLIYTHIYLVFSHELFLLLRISCSIFFLPSECIRHQVIQPIQLRLCKRKIHGFTYEAQTKNL